MVTIPVQCPHCHSTEVIKAGKQATGSQRYQCQNGQCARRIFLLQYQDLGRVPEVRRQVVDMALNGSGVRATARVLRISPTTVIAVLKKSVRPLISEHKRSGGMLSGRDEGRSAARGSRRG
jgi:insertion element IS1 protein InsB